MNDRVGRGVGERGVFNRSKLRRDKVTFFDCRHVTHRPVARLALEADLAWPTGLICLVMSRMIAFFFVWLYVCLFAISWRAEQVRPNNHVLAGQY